MFEYSQRAFETQYSIIKDILTNDKNPNVYPKAYILGGQPGAGISVEGNTEKNEISVIRIPPTQSSKAEKIFYQNPNVSKK